MSPLELLALLGCLATLAFAVMAVHSPTTLGCVPWVSDLAGVYVSTRPVLTHVLRLMMMAAFLGYVSIGIFAIVRLLQASELESEALGFVGVLGGGAIGFYAFIGLIAGAAHEVREEERRREERRQEEHRRFIGSLGKGRDEQG